MDLRGLAHGLTATIVPDVTGDLYQNQGGAVGYGGKRTPSYVRVPNQKFQVQAMSTGALRRAESLNIQGVKRQVYYGGHLKGVERLSGKGGDLLFFGGSYWLVNEVMEEWDGNGWCKAIVVQQVNAPEVVLP